MRAFAAETGPAPVRGLRAVLAASVRPMRGRFAIAALLAAVTAAAGVGLLGLSGWFLAGAAVAGAAGPTVAIAFNTPLPSAFIRLLAMVRTAGRYGERMTGHDAAFRAMARLRPAVFAHLAASPPRWALSVDAGDAAARLVEDVGELEQHLVRRSAWAAAAGALLAGGIALCLGGGWRVLAAVLAVIAVQAGLAGALSRAQARRHAALPAALGALRSAVLRVQRARAELRAHGLEAAATAEVMRHSDTVGALQRRIGSAGGWFAALHAAGATLAATVALGLSAGPGVTQAALAGLGALAMAEAAGAPLAGLERRGPLHAARRRIDALVQHGAPSRGAPIQPAQPLTVDGTPLAPGRVVALRGASGAGKTSLLETLLRLRAPPPGRIAIGGRDLADLSAGEARGQFSLAAQDAPILSGTVRDNLRLASPMADDESLYDALAIADLDDRVRDMRDGLDAWLGDGGVTLSGGEARRLGLARALLRPAPWLLLDEPTEGLDAATEARVVARLGAHLRRSGQGAIIVSHRPAPLALCEAELRV